MKNSNLSIGERIGQGRTAEIYAWGDGQVLKLYRPGIPASWASHEARVAQAVGPSCSFSPAYGGTVEIAGTDGARMGIIYERVSGPTLLQLLVQRPYALASLARQMAHLHAAVHAVDLHAPGAEELPALHDMTRHDVSRGPVSEAVRALALGALAALPHGDRLCHRDFHPEQVVLTPRGPVILDWMTAGIGSPAADVARTSLILTMGGPPADLPRTKALMVQALRGLFNTLYLRYYRRSRPLDMAEYRVWQPILAIGRLDEHVPGEEPRLRALIEHTYGPH